MSYSYWLEYSADTKRGTGHIYVSRVDEPMLDTDTHLYSKIEAEWDTLDEALADLNQTYKHQKQIHICGDDPYPIDPDVTMARMKRKQASRLTYDPELYSNTGKDNLMWAWRPQAANWWVEFTGVPTFEREQAVIAHVRQLIAEGAGFDNMDAIERLVFEQEFGVKLHKWEGHFHSSYEEHV